MDTRVAVDAIKKKTQRELHLSACAFESHNKEKVAVGRVQTFVLLIRRALGIISRKHTAKQVSVTLLKNVQLFAKSLYLPESLLTNC